LQDVVNFVCLQTGSLSQYVLMKFEKKRKKKPLSIGTKL